MRTSDSASGQRNRRPACQRRRVSGTSPVRGNPVLRCIAVCHVPPSTIGGGGECTPPRRRVCRGGRTNDRRHARRTHADQCGLALAQSRLGPHSPAQRMTLKCRAWCESYTWPRVPPNTTAPGVMTPLKLSLCDVGLPPHEKRRTGSERRALPTEQSQSTTICTHALVQCAALLTTTSVATPSRTLTLIPHHLEETHTRTHTHRGPTAGPTHSPHTSHARSFLFHTAILRCTSFLLPSSLLKTSDLQTRQWARWCN